MRRSPLSRWSPQWTAAERAEIDAIKSLMRMSALERLQHDIVLAADRYGSRTGRSVTIAVAADGLELSVTRDA